MNDTDARLAGAHRWLAERYPGRTLTLAPASADASFRRYFRVTGAATGTLIVMDAPPDKEDCAPFVRIAALLGAAGVNVPTVLAEDRARGYLLLADLGSTTYLAALEAASPAARDALADRLYRDAIGALVKIQQAAGPGVLPDYDRALLERELRLFPEWFVARQLGRTLTAAQTGAIEEAFAAILANNLAQPRVVVHRDYHSRNLMLDPPSGGNPGVLDFQDAVYGPITYDAVSLLRDAYVSWPEDRVIDWLVRYWQAARAAGLPVAADFGALYRDFEWMGVQRQIKVVGIFARLAIRDGKRRYLDDQPLVMRYLRAACHRYRALGRFAALLDELCGDAPRAGYTF